MNNVMKQPKGFISDIQLYSIKDGPGIRSAVFFVGCNLRCLWCANPELIEFCKKYMYFESRCVRCGACAAVASNQAIAVTEKGCIIDRERCVNLDKCMDICPQNAYKKIGREITAEELFNKLLRDKTFYDLSGGGVTFTGGEAALQGDFLIEISQKLQAAGIHTALDTAGNIPWGILKPILEHIDMVLYDIKAYAGALHKQCTGVTNELILENARLIAEMKKDMIIRLVIVPGYNDILEDIKQRLLFIKNLGESVKRIDVLPYHNLGVGKYARLGMKYPLEQERFCEDELIESIRRTASECGVSISVE